MSKHVFGVGPIIARLRKYYDATAKAVEEVTPKACELVKRESQKIVPVDKGDLHDSAFTYIEGKGFFTEGYVGYWRHYAIWVHENLENNHAPGKQAQFLVAPLRRLRPRILQMYANAIRRKHFNKKAGKKKT